MGATPGAHLHSHYFIIAACARRHSLWHLCPLLSSPSTKRLSQGHGPRSRSPWKVNGRAWTQSDSCHCPARQALSQGATGETEPWDSGARLSSDTKEVGEGQLALQILTPKSRVASPSGRGQHGDAQRLTPALPGMTWQTPKGHKVSLVHQVLRDTTEPLLTDVPAPPAPLSHRKPCHAPIQNLGPGPDLCQAG